MARPLKIDFSNTDDKGKFYVPPGKYTVRCVQVTQESSTYPYLQFTFEVLGHGVNIRHNCTLKPDALFNLKNTLSALLGKEVPKSVVTIDIDKLVGKICTAHIADREYNGKTYCNITRLEPYTEPTDVSSDINDLDEL
jgi:hypothetical protein